MMRTATPAEAGAISATGSADRLAVGCGPGGAGLRRTGPAATRTRTSTPFPTAGSTAAALRAALTTSFTAAIAALGHRLQHLVGLKGELLTLTP